jgi:hypothetical protein
MPVYFCLIIIFIWSSIALLGLGQVVEVKSLRVDDPRPPLFSGFLGDVQLLRQRLLLIRLPHVF